MHDPSWYGQSSSRKQRGRGEGDSCPFSVSPEYSQTVFENNQMGGWRYLNCWFVKKWLIWAWKQDYCPPVVQGDAQVIVALLSGAGQGVSVQMLILASMARSCLPWVPHLPGSLFFTSPQQLLTFWIPVAIPNSSPWQMTLFLLSVLGCIFQVAFCGEEKSGSTVDRVLISRTYT